MLIAVAIGLGQSIQSSQILYISCFGMYALFALGFKSNKYLIALCDGMGSGNFARKKSATAISLIENF